MSHNIWNVSNGTIINEKIKKWYSWTVLYFILQVAQLLIRILFTFLKKGEDDIENWTSTFGKFYICYIWVLGQPFKEILSSHVGWKENHTIYDRNAAWIRVAAICSVGTGGTSRFLFGSPLEELLDSLWERFFDLDPFGLSVVECTYVE